MTYRVTASDGTLDKAVETEEEARRIRTRFLHSIKRPETRLRHPDSEPEPIPDVVIEEVK